MDLGKRRVTLRCKRDGHPPLSQLDGGRGFAGPGGWHRATGQIAEKKIFMKTDYSQAYLDALMFLLVGYFGTVLKDSRPMTDWEREAAADFFWSEFD